MSTVDNKKTARHWPGRVRKRVTPDTVATFTAVNKHRAVDGTVSADNGGRLSEGVITRDVSEPFARRRTVENATLSRVSAIMSMCTVIRVTITGRHGVAG